MCKPAHVHTHTLCDKALPLSAVNGAGLSVPPPDAWCLVPGAWCLWSETCEFLRMPCGGELSARSPAVAPALRPSNAQPAALCSFGLGSSETVRSTQTHLRTEWSKLLLCLEACVFIRCACVPSFRRYCCEPRLCRRQHPESLHFHFENAS